jgi:hypothetical protein
LQLFSHLIKTDIAANQIAQLKKTKTRGAMHSHGGTHTIPSHPSIFSFLSPQHSLSRPPTEERRCPPAGLAQARPPASSSAVAPPAEHVGTAAPRRPRQVAIRRRSSLAASRPACALPRLALAARASHRAGRLPRSRPVPDGTVARRSPTPASRTRARLHLVAASRCSEPLHACCSAPAPSCRSCN